MSIHRGAQGGQLRWTDLRSPLGRDKQGQTSLPDFDFTEMALMFPQNDPTEIAYFILQMPHEMLVGGDLKPHVHFIQDVAQQPTFKLDYRWYENGADPTGAFTTITAVTFAFTWTAGSILQIAAFPAIDGSGITSVSSMIDCKLYRDDNDVAGDVAAKEFDLHYQIDDWGSRQEYVK